MSAAMHVSHAGIELIKSFERLCLESYPDPATGCQPYTVGWGHTLGVHMGMRITADQAETFFQADVAQVEHDLQRVVHVVVTQGQWDALVSLCFNLAGGALALSRIAPHLVAKLNAGDKSGAANEFLDIDRANGRVMPGLVRRRAAERVLFLS